MQKICIIIPCYNEEKRLQVTLFENFFKGHKNYYACFVNDGSIDNTKTILENLQIKIGGNCNVLSLPKNEGKAEAVRYGFLNNINAGFDYIGFFDSDLSTPLQEIDNFIRYSGGELKHDIIMGSRVCRLGANIVRNPWRHYIGRVFSTFASLILKLKVYDTQCGAKLISNKYSNKIFENKFISKWLFDIELLFRAIITFNIESVKANTLEVPLNTWIEIKGTKLKFYDFFKTPYELTKIWFFYRNKKN